jgi:hypothetical protein
VIDGEAACCDRDGIPVFERMRGRRHDGHVFLYAFDLLELNGEDMWRALGNLGPLCYVAAREGWGLRVAPLLLTAVLRTSVFGYLSGANVETAVPISCRGRDADGLPARIENYCRRNP